MENHTDPIKIKVILGSTRESRFSEKPAEWIYEESKKLDGVEVEMLDLRDYAIPFFESPMPPSMAGGQYNNEVVQKWAAKINEADAYIIVTAEYNHGYPAVLKNAMDVLYPEWNRKPVGFVSYGSAMGARAVEQLRQVAVELQMAPIRHSVHIPVDIFMTALMGGGPEGSELFKPIQEGQGKDPVQTFLDDLMWWAQALKKARKTN